MLWVTMMNFVWRVKFQGAAQLRGADGGDFLAPIVVEDEEVRAPGVRREVGLGLRFLRQGGDKSPVDIERPHRQQRPRHEGVRQAQGEVELRRKEDVVVSPDARGVVGGAVQRRIEKLRRLISRDEDQDLGVERRIGARTQQKRGPEHDPAEDVTRDETPAPRT
jgi:hypothetical protein